VKEQSCKLKIALRSLVTLRFHVGSQDMQGKVHWPVMIVVGGYMITIALRGLLYLNSTPA